MRVTASHGLSPVEAASGDDALAILRRVGEIPICISDIYMPGMDGVTFLREALLRYPDMAVIMLTGMAEVNTAVEVFLRRVENPRLVVDPPPYRQSSVFRGPEHLVIDCDGIKD